MKNDILPFLITVSIIGFAAFVIATEGNNAKSRLLALSKNADQICIANYMNEKLSNEQIDFWVKLIENNRTPQYISMYENKGNVLVDTFNDGYFYCVKRESK